MTIEQREEQTVDRAGACRENFQRSIVEMVRARDSVSFRPNYRLSISRALVPHRSGFQIQRNRGIVHYISILSLTMVKPLEGVAHIRAQQNGCAGSSRLVIPTRLRRTRRLAVRLAYAPLGKG